MKKQEFLDGLRKALSGIPQEDIEERISFYGEMIDDRMEEGMSEEEAVAGIGTIDEIRSQILADIPLPKLVKEKVKRKRSFQAVEIVLIILGFPLWFPLLVVLGAILFTVYMVILSLIVSVWAVELALVVGIFGGLVAAVIYFLQSRVLPAMLLLAAAFLVAGLSVFVFYGCIAASKVIIKLTKKVGIGIKSLFIRGGKKE